jgi:hypothetical protein
MFRLLKITATALMLALVSVEPVSAQYGPSRVAQPGLTSAPIASPRAIFRQSLSPQVTEKTSSILLDVLATMSGRLRAL